MSNGRNLGGIRRETLSLRGPFSEGAGGPQPSQQGHTLVADFLEGPAIDKGSTHFSCGSF